MMNGKFITLEGSEGSGKSTQLQLIEGYLKKNGRDVMTLREPGGVAISEKIRQIILDVKNEGMCDEAETLLYMAARAQLVVEKIKPALDEGKIVICDRFLDSTMAYQGYGNGVNLEFIEHLGTFVTQNIQPDLTLLFDIDTEQGLSRTNIQKDRIEQRSLDYHQHVREGYLALARQNPDRIYVIAVDRPKEEIFDQICPLVRRVVDL